MEQLFLTAPYPHANLWMRVKYPRNRNSNMEKTMRDSKFGLRAFGLALVAALGLMAFMAVAAQAEKLGDGGKEASFLVEKSTALAHDRCDLQRVADWHRDPLSAGEGRHLMHIRCRYGEFLQLKRRISGN